jgi:hypothetical protein
MRYLLSIPLAAPFLAALAAVRSAPQESYVPPHGFVPDSATAARIAEAVWIPIYGEASIARQRPFRAELRGGVWTVRGTLPRARPGWARAGGVALAQIAKRNGRIIRVTHGR